MAPTPTHVIAATDIVGGQYVICEGNAFGRIVARFPRTAEGYAAASSTLAALPQPFDALTKQQQHAAIEAVQMDGEGYGRDPVTAWEAERFLRSLDADQLAKWVQP